MSILLINPPVAKLCEPPAGIARLAGSLRQHGVLCWVADLNLDCMLELIEYSKPEDDTWSRRASKNKYRHLSDLRSPATYRSPDRYRRAVHDINRVISSFGRNSGHDISLTNFSESGCSPLISRNLSTAAEHYEKNPFYPSFSRLIDHLIKQHTPHYVGISMSYLSQAINGFAIVGYLKENYPDLVTIAGGGLITSWMRSQKRTNNFETIIDHFIAGPGEHALLQLFGKESSDILGTPDYRGFDFGRYLAPGPILPYATSDGCYWKKCTFCPDQAENTPYWQNKPERVTEELTDLTRIHKPVLLHFLDNAISPPLFKQLIENPPLVPWYGFARFERELEDAQFCKSLKDSGCIMLKLGLESGSQMVLNQMKKGTALGSVSRILENLEAAGIATYIYLLFGTPHEAENEALMTLDFVRDHHSAITFMNLAIFNMPVCSSDAAGVSGRFSDGDLSLYCDFKHPRGWDRKSIRHFLQNTFRKDPLISPIILRDPPYFTSNHAPLLCLEQLNGIS